MQTMRCRHDHFRGYSCTPGGSVTAAAAATATVTALTTCTLLVHVFVTEGAHDPPAPRHLRLLVLQRLGIMTWTHVYRKR
jgi:hypothetical protein